MISSVFFSVFFCVMLKALTDGSCDYIIDAVVERQTGTLQIMSPEYWDEKTVDNYIAVDEQTLSQWEQAENVERLTPRIESYAMAWNGKRTKGLVFIGIDPKRETVFSHLNTRVLEGEFLSQNDQGAMLGKRCAELLGVKLGDTLTLVGMGYQGESAYGLFPVTAIIEAFDPLLDEKVVYTSLATMQQFISMPDGASAVSVLLKNPKKIDKTIVCLQETADQQIACQPWKTLIEGTMAGASDNKKQMIVYFYFLYVIVGFGLLGMVIMLTNERKKEFGVMSALGTKKRTIIGSLFWEMIWVSFIGILAGLAFSVPIAAYYHYYPITMTGEMADALLSFGLEPVMPFAFTFNMFVTQAIIVFSMVLIVSLYPVLTIGRMKTIKALKG